MIRHPLSLLPGLPVFDRLPFPPLERWSRWSASLADSQQIPRGFLEVSWQILSRFPAVSQPFPRIFLAFPSGFLAVSQQFPGSFLANSWQCPSSFSVVSLQFPRSFPAVSQWFPGSVPILSRQISCSFRAVSQQFPGSFPAVSRQFPGSSRGRCSRRGPQGEAEPRASRPAPPGPGAAAAAPAPLQPPPGVLNPTAPGGITQAGIWGSASRIGLKMRFGRVELSPPKYKVMGTGSGFIFRLFFSLQDLHL